MPAVTKKLHKADLGEVESPELGSANAEALETQRRIQWATDPDMFAELFSLLYPPMACISWISNHMYTYFEAPVWPIFFV